MTVPTVSSGATKITKVLTATGQEVTLWCAGQVKIGIGILAMTGVNTVSLTGSQDGKNFNPLVIGSYPSATPPATPAISVSSTGNWEANAQDYQFIRAQLTSGVGPVTVVLTASDDGSYQEAFVTQAALYPSKSSAAGRNSVNIPAQANRAINVTFATVAMAGPGFGANGTVRIWDGPVNTGVILYSEFLVSPIGSVGTVQKLTLPVDSQGNAGVQGTPGNEVNIEVVGTGANLVTVNARASFI